MPLFCHFDAAAGGAEGREWGDVWDSQREDPAAVGATAGSSGGARCLQWAYGHIQEEEPWGGERTFSSLVWTPAVVVSTVAALCQHFSFLFQLQAEVQRLEELKLLNIRSVTDAIRSEMAVFWEKCFFSSDQRQAFAPYFSGGFTSCF